MKNKIIIYICGFLIVLAVFVVIGLIFFKNIYGSITSNQKLDVNNYNTAIEINSKADFILLINKKEKVSNIIFLNEESVKSLYKKNIEGKNIYNALEYIVKAMDDNKNFQDDNKSVILTNYGNNDIFSNAFNEFSKNLVIYGIEKQVEEQNSTLEQKLSELNLQVSNQNDNLKELYNYSLNVVGSNLYGKNTIN